MTQNSVLLSLPFDPDSLTPEGYTQRLVAEDRVLVSVPERLTKAQVLLVDLDGRVLQRFVVPDHTPEHDWLCDAEYRAFYDLRWLDRGAIVAAHGWDNYDGIDHLFLWNTSTGDVRGIFQKRHLSYGRLLLSPSGRFLVASGDDGDPLSGWSLRAVDLATSPSSWPLIGTWRGPHPNSDHMAFTWEDSLLIVAGSIVDSSDQAALTDTRIQVIETASCRLRLCHEQPGHCHAIALSPDGRWLAALVGGSTVSRKPIEEYELRLWSLPDVTSKACVSFSSPESPFPYTTTPMVFTPDGQHLKVHGGYGVMASWLIEDLTTSRR